MSILKNMVMKVHGLSQRWNHKSIIGYSDTETVKLDFDNTSFKDVSYWALKALKQFKLGGFVILKSSGNSYHVVFNRTVSWSENMHIVAWVSLLSKNRAILKWLPMQCIKESSTLRVSHKRKKPPPRIIYRYGKQDDQIQSFLKYRRIIKNMITRFKPTDGDPKVAE